MSRAARVKLIHPHLETDFDPYHEMVLMGYRKPDVEYRDSLGRRHQHGYTRWHRAICNNPDCPGEALIQLDRVTVDACSEVGL